MSKKPTRLKKLRLTELSLVSAGANQHSSIGIFKAAEPEPALKPGEFPTVAEVAKALTGASPEVLAIFKAQQDEMRKMLAEFSIDKQDENMTTDPNHHWNKAVAEHAAKHDLPISKAAVDILSARPDLVEQAYRLDTETAVTREQAHVTKSYGGAK